MNKDSMWMRPPSGLHQVIPVANDVTTVTLFGSYGSVDTSTVYADSFARLSEDPLPLLDVEQFGRLLDVVIHELRHPKEITTDHLQTLPDRLGRSPLAVALLRAIDPTTRSLLDVPALPPPDVSVIGGPRSIHDPPIKAVVVSLDGVLVDLARMMRATAAELATELGVPRIGDRRGRVDGRMIESAAPEMDFDDIRGVRRRLERRGVHTARSTSSLVRPRSDVLRLLAELPRSVPLAVWTGNGAEATRSYAELAGISLPEVVVTGDDVDVGKPSPEGLMLIAHQLAIHPRNILVVDHSPDGIAAAEAAGMCVAGIDAGYDLSHSRITPTTGFRGVITPERASFSATPGGITLQIA